MCQCESAGELKDVLLKTTLTDVTDEITSINFILGLFTCSLSLNRNDQDLCKLYFPLFSLWPQSCVSCGVRGGGGGGRTRAKIFIWSVRKT